MIIQPDDEGPWAVRKRPWWLWPAILAVCLVIVGGVLVVTLAQTGQKTVDNAAVADAIQKERARATRISCEAQNVRHEVLLHAFDPLIAKAGPQTAEEQTNARLFTTALADAIAPARDCDAVVRRSVSAGGP